MDLAQSNEFGLFQAWNHPKNAFLLPKAQVILKPYQIIAISS